jgi:nucleoside-diphosphate-sugar epimerase
MVTGGAGFVGSNTCAALVRDGDDVHVVDNFSSGYRLTCDCRALEHYCIWTEADLVVRGAGE